MVSWKTFIFILSNLQTQLLNSKTEIIYNKQKLTLQKLKLVQR